MRACQVHRHPAQAAAFPDIAPTAILLCRFEREHQELAACGAAARIDLPSAVAAQAQSTMARDTIDKQLRAVAARLRAAALGGLASGSVRAPVPYKLLHECFHFRNAAHDQAASALDALNLMTGVSRANVIWCSRVVQPLPHMCYGWQVTS